MILSNAKVVLFLATNKERLPIYITDELKQQLKKEAQADGRSLNNYIVFILNRRDRIQEVKIIQDQLNEND